MSIAPPPGSARITPYLAYEDPVAAIDWLERAFGLTTKVRIEDGDGHVVHCELAYAEGVVGIGAPTDAGRSPKSLEGRYTQSLYVFVDSDIEDHAARAEAAGAKIVRPLVEADYGDRNYGAEDPWGHLWFFGQRVDQAAWDASLRDHDVTHER